mgnify:CR=1 FL=1
MFKLHLLADMQGAHADEMWGRNFLNFKSFGNYHSMFILLRGSKEYVLLLTSSVYSKELFVNDFSRIFHISISLMV